MKEKILIDHRKLSLDEWLDYVKVEKSKRQFQILDCQFATDLHRDEYLRTIQNRSDAEVKYLLSLFLISGGHLGHDDFLRDWLYCLPREEFETVISQRTFLKRVAFPRKENPPWATITWVIDLLPNFPQEAIQAINSYFQAHCEYFPDARIHGLSDAQSLIRAKYMEHSLPVKQTLLDMTSRDFELLVAFLYKEKGYKVIVTQRTRDGGYDIVAEKYSDREQERLHVECKRYDENVGVTIARQILGTLNVTNATKAVLVASTNFTQPARDEAHRSKRLELIDVNSFDVEMRHHIDMHWVFKVPEFVMRMKKEL